jgi:predicted P-loop ATPase
VSAGKVTKFRGRAPDWRDQLSRTRDGDCRATPHNLVTILRNDETVRGRVAWNAFAERIDVLEPLPGPVETGTGILADTHLIGLAAWLGQPETYACAAKPAQIADAVSLVAREHAYHPPREYFGALVWDGTPRIATMFADLFGAEASPYCARVAEMLMVAVVTRAHTPGAKVDTVVILEGEQGRGKTRAVRELCNPAWYAEAHGVMGATEFLLLLRGALIVEIGELSSMTRADYARAKQAITAQVDHYRDPYARLPRSIPRQCVFIGTTNDDSWGRDPTGARRFLPVRVGTIDIDRLIATRDQLWAEAMHLYRAGTDYWTLPADAADEQEDRYDADAWAEPIHAWLDGRVTRDGAYPIDLDLRPVDQGGGIRSCSVAEVLRHALGVSTDKHTRADQMRVAAIMRHAGWAKARGWHRGARGVRWYRPDAEVDDVPF